MPCWILMQKVFWLILFRVILEIKARKRSVLEILRCFVGEMRGTEVILLSGHRSGVDNKRNSSEWRHFAAVKSVRTVERTILEINRSGPIWRKRSQKGFHQSGSRACLLLVWTWTAELKPLETKIAEILSEAGVFSLLSLLLMEKWKTTNITLRIILWGFFFSILCFVCLVNEQNVRCKTCLQSCFDFYHFKTEVCWLARCTDREIGKELL